jgi:Ca2+-transporting ATPase
MGGRGTDVAREAASLILLDDDFGSIVRAVRLGRRIYDNLRKAMGYILAMHLPIAGLALLPIVIGQPLVLTPMLIAFLELIIDPACSIVLEAEREEADVMTRRPRDPHASLMSRDLISWSLLQGTIAVLVVDGAYLLILWAGMSEQQTRSFAFLTLVAANIALIFVNRTFSISPAAALRRPNPSLVWGFGLTAAALCAMLLIPALRKFFGLAALNGIAFAGVVALGFALFLVLQAVKRAWVRQLVT